MNRTIRKVAVLGSGIMGSRIALHFANIGCDVLLLDIAPKDLTDDEKKKGLTLDHPAVKNRIVQSSYDAALKSNPAPLYSKKFAPRVKLGNFTDDMSKIKSCDWTIEVVVENLEIKKKVYEEVERHRTPGTLITSNTSGIPIHLMAEGRSEDFQKHFALKTRSCFSFYRFSCKAKCLERNVLYKGFNKPNWIFCSYFVF